MARLELDMQKAEVLGHVAAPVVTSEIEQRVKQLALQISKDYEGKELVVVSILTGAICFMTDLLKHLLIPYKMDFMMLSSYGTGSKSSGVVMLKKDLARDPSGQHILIVGFGQVGQALLREFEGLGIFPDRPWR